MTLVPSAERTLALAVLIRAGKDAKRDPAAERWLRWNIPTRQSMRWWAERAGQDPGALREALL